MVYFLSKQLKPKGNVFQSSRRNIYPTTTRPCRIFKRRRRRFFFGPWTCFQCSPSRRRHLQRAQSFPNMAYKPVRATGTRTIDHSLTCTHRDTRLRGRGGILRNRCELTHEALLSLSQSMMQGKSYGAGCIPPSSALTPS